MKDHINVHMNLNLNVHVNVYLLYLDEYMLLLFKNKLAQPIVRMGGWWVKQK